MNHAPHSADIDSFNQHGSAFWDINGPYRTLHHVNPARVAFIERYITLPGKHILDMGCGGGILSEALADKGAKVTGIDLSETVLQAAQAHCANKNIHYRLSSAAQCVANGEQYDHITCMEMLEHVADPAAILRDITALLKPGGYAFFSTVNRTVKARLGVIIAAEYLSRLIPRGTHQYDWFIRPAELVSTAARAGLKPVALAGLDYLPLCKKARLSGNTDINYLFAARKEKI